MTRFHTCPSCRHVFEADQHDEARCAARARITELVDLIPKKRDEAITLRRKNGDMTGSAKESRDTDQRAATAELEKLAMLEELFDVCSTIFGKCTTGGER